MASLQCAEHQRGAFASVKHCIRQKANPADRHWFEMALLVTAPAETGVEHFQTDLVEMGPARFQEDLTGAVPDTDYFQMVLAETLLVAGEGFQMGLIETVPENSRFQKDFETEGTACLP